MTTFMGRKPLLNGASSRPFQRAVRKQRKGNETMSDGATWRKLILQEMGKHGEHMQDAISCTLSRDEMDTPFDDGYGGSEGKPFTLWTSKRVYFLAVYDGSEWVESVSRDPDGKPTGHIGGE